MIESQDRSVALNMPQKSFVFVGLAVASDHRAFCSKGAVWWGEVLPSNNGALCAEQAFLIAAQPHTQIGLVA